MRSLFPDFAEFLQILNQLKVRYMVIGGWALGWHGWPRLTKDIDIWVAVDGRDFDDCYSRAKTIAAGDLDVKIISLEDFKINKRVSGRLRDLADLEDLGEDV